MTFVAKMATDSKEIDSPSWDDVERAIESLDGERHTIVMLAPAPPLGPPDGDHHMAVGGGKGGKYVVYMTLDNLHFGNLVAPEFEGDVAVVRQTIGGQEGEYAVSQCVSRQLALKAARKYFETGERAELEWREG